MRFEAQGTQQASRQLGQIRDRLGPEQQKWVFTKLLDDLYAIQRMWWTKQFGGKTDKSKRPGNPPAYMFKTGDLKAAATTKNAANSYNQATDQFALVGLKGDAEKLAGIHRGLGRDVIAEITKHDNKNLTESMGRFLFAAGGAR